MRSSRSSLSSTPSGKCIWVWAIDDSGTNAMGFRKKSGNVSITMKRVTRAIVTGREKLEVCDGG